MPQLVEIPGGGAVHFPKVIGGGVDMGQRGGRGQADRCGEETAVSVMYDRMIIKTDSRKYNFKYLASIVNKLNTTDI